MQGYITNINNNTDNDVSSVNSECDYLIDELSDKYNLSLDVILKEENIDNIEKSIYHFVLKNVLKSLAFLSRMLSFIQLKRTLIFGSIRLNKILLFN